MITPRLSYFDVSVVVTEVERGEDGEPVYHHKHVNKTVGVIASKMPQYKFNQKAWEVVKDFKTERRELKPPKPKCPVHRCVHPGEYKTCIAKMYERRQS